MAESPDATPAGVPPLPEHLAAGLREAAAYPDRRPTAYVRLAVTGGVHGERYDFEYVADAAGNVRSHLVDELHGRTARAADAAPVVDRAAFGRLVDTIDVDAIRASSPPSGGFPPDSVVGWLEISDGQQVARFPFLADEAVAERPGRRSTAPLAAAVDTLFGAAAAVLGTNELRP